MKFQLKLGSHLHLGMYLGIVLRILTHRKVAHFPQFSSYIWKDRIFMKILPEMYLVPRKTTLSYGSRPDLGVFRSRSALAEVCSHQVLLLHHYVALKSCIFHQITPRWANCDTRGLYMQPANVFTWLLSICSPKHTHIKIIYLLKNTGTVACSERLQWDFVAIL